MEETDNHIPIMDWRPAAGILFWAIVIAGFIILVSAGRPAAGILFWAIVIAGFIILVSAGRPMIPEPVLEIIRTSTGQGNLIIAHRDGDPVRFANTRCVWIPDLSNPGAIERASSLVMVGEEIEQGRVSNLEPGETATLERTITLKTGRVGRLVITDFKSGLEIFSQTVRISG